MDATRHGHSGDGGAARPAVGRGRAVALVALLAFGAWIAVIAAVSRNKFGGDPRGMLFLGTEIHHAAAFDGIPRCGRFGYDGQFYAALALDPFLRSPETLAALDAPGLRAGRILVPLAAWAAALGRPRAAIVAYQLLGWALGALAVVLVALWLRAQRASPWWAALLVVNAGLVTAMLRSTLDGAATCLVVAAAFLQARAGTRAGAGAACLAALARDTGAISGIAGAAEELARRNVRRALAYLVLPLACVLAWQAYLQAVWRPNVRFPSAIGVPLAALVRKLGEVARVSHPLLSQELWAIVGAALTVAAALALLVLGPRTGPPRLAFLAFAALAACLSARQYVEAYNSSRVIMAAPFLAVVGAGAERNGVLRWLLLAGPVAFAWSGVLMIGRELGLL